MADLDLDLRKVAASFQKMADLNLDLVKVAASCIKMADLDLDLEKDAASLRGLTLTLTLEKWCKLLKDG